MTATALALCLPALAQQSQPQPNQPSSQGQQQPGRADGQPGPAGRAAAEAPGQATATMPHPDAPASFSSLAKDKLPAVVTITAAGEMPVGPGGAPGQSPFPPGSPFEDFFEDFFGGPGGPAVPGGPRTRPLRSLGSGFIIDPGGYIVTNNHVVEGAQDIEVALQSGRTLDATVVGTDPATDIALLRVEVDEPLPALAWGDSDQAEVGDWVLAIGNPFGLGGSVTSGIVSARARDIGAGAYDNFIQTDAAINSGNSGGPLIAMNGRVVGVNTAIFSRTGGSIGIGFAVPSDIARQVVAELREEGFVTRGYLGVSIQPVTEEIAEAFGIQPGVGALVSSVAPGTPAAEAGLEPGDIITAYQGEDIEEPRALSRAVADTDPGQRAQLTLLREGEQQQLTVRIGELPRDDQPTAAAAGPDEGTLGLTLAPITPDLRQRFDLSEEVEGAAVVAVAPGSVAAERGFRAGDVITRANQQPVESPGDLREAIESARKQGRESVVVLRQSGQGTVFVPLPVNPSQRG